MVKILLISGSSRLNGNTVKILKLLEASIKMAAGSGAEVYFEYIDIVNMKLEPCRGCRACFDLGEKHCPCKDGAGDIRVKLSDADIVIVGSPVYVEDASGSIVNFIDRLAYCTHRPFMNGIPVYVFTTSGSGASSHAAKTIKHAFVSWGGCIAGSDNYRMGTHMDYDEAGRLYAKRLSDRTERLLFMHRKGIVSIYSLIAFGVQKKFWNKSENQKNGTDYNYWKNNGWLEKQRIYYRDIKVGKIKRLTAKVLCQLVSLIMVR